MSSLALALVLAIGGFGSLGGLPFIFLAMIAMYLLLIVPNQRKQKQWQAMLSKIKTGDRVTTTGGIRGTVVTAKDDVLVVRTQPDGVKLEFTRAAISAVTTDEETTVKG